MKLFDFRQACADGCYSGQHNAYGPEQIKERPAGDESGEGRKEKQVKKFSSVRKEHPAERGKQAFHDGSSMLLYCASFLYRPLGF
jgi:hypothetical protein